MRDDALVGSEELRFIFEAIGADEKRLFWVNDTRARWDGYLHFLRHPDVILEWFETYMK